MLRITKEAAALLVAARKAEGGLPTAGIRIRRSVDRERSGNEALAIGFGISNEPEPDDEEFEQNGLRIFVEEALVEPLDGCTLDVGDVGDGPELLFR
jgi:iron-sulfur cluster assembly protein